MRQIFTVIYACLASTKKSLGVSGTGNISQLITKDNIMLVKIAYNIAITYLKTIAFRVVLVFVLTNPNSCEMAARFSVAWSSVVCGGRGRGLSGDYTPPPLACQTSSRCPTYQPPPGLPETPVGQQSSHGHVVSHLCSHLTLTSSTLSPAPCLLPYCLYSAIPLHIASLLIYIFLSTTVSITFKLV